MSKEFWGNEMILKNRDDAFFLTNSARHDAVVSALLKDYDQERISKSFLPQQISNEFCQTQLYYTEKQIKDDIGFFSSNLMEVRGLEYLRIQYSKDIDTYHVNHVRMPGSDLDTILHGNLDFTFNNFGFYSTFPEALSALYEFEREIKKSDDITKIIVSREDLGDCHYIKHAQNLGYAFDKKRKFHEVLDKGLVENGSFSLGSLLCTDGAQETKKLSIESHIEGLFKVLIEGFVYHELKNIDNIKEIDSLGDSYGFVSMFEGVKSLSKKKKNTDFTSERSMKSLKSYFNAQKMASNLALEVLLRSFSGDREYLRSEFDALLTTTTEIDWSKIGTVQEFLAEKIEKVKAQYHDKEKDFLDKASKLQEGSKKVEEEKGRKAKASLTQPSSRNTQPPSFSPWSK